MIFTVYSSRNYGEPKLTKPEPLRGIEQSFPEPFIRNKCSFSVFVLKDADQVWIKARDWFSPSFVPPDPNDMGKSQRETLAKYFPDQKSRNNKFAYPDNFADIVLRSEAWICFEGIFKEADDYNNRRLFDRTSPTQIWILQKMIEGMEKVLGFPEYELTCSDWERFLERVINRLDIESI